MATPSAGELEALSGPTTTLPSCATTATLTVPSRTKAPPASRTAKRALREGAPDSGLEREESDDQRRREQHAAKREAITKRSPRDVTERGPRELTRSHRG